MLMTTGLGAIQMKNVTLFAIPPCEILLLILIFKIMLIARKVTLAIFLELNLKTVDFYKVWKMFNWHNLLVDSVDYGFRLRQQEVNLCVSFDHFWGKHNF